MINWNTLLRIAVKLDELGQGWKRLFVIYGLFAVVIYLAKNTNDLSGVAMVVTAIGGVLGGLGVFINIAKVAKAKGIEP